MTRTFPAMRRTAALLGIALFVSPANPQGQLRYRLTDVTPPNAGAEFFPPDIDDRGRVAGFTANTPGDATGFLRSRNGRYLDLEPLPGATAVGVSGIGQNGLVAGGSGADLFFAASATVWDRRGRARDIGSLPGDTFALATDTDFWGRVIGASGTVNNVDTVPFVWHRGVMRTLPNPLPFGEAIAFGLFGSIAANGWTTAQSGPGSDPEGYLIDWHAVVRRVGRLPGGTFSRLTDMNLVGTAVGSADDGSGIENAIVYRRGQLTSMGTLPGDFAAVLQAINLWGTAVGQSFGPMGPRAIISRFGGPLEDLNTMLDPATPPSVLVFGATGVNNLGQIVAGAVDFATLPPSLSFVLLTPYLQ